MQVHELAAALFILCGVRPDTPHNYWPRPKKEVCVEEMVNCAIGPNGVVIKDVEEKCLRSVRGQK